MRGAAIDVVFWSGGKDSWLAWNAAQKAGRSSVWFTTYDPACDVVPVQEVEVATLERQSSRAEQSLFLQPVGADGDYRGQVLSGLDTIARRHRVERLVFGDPSGSPISALRARSSSATGQRDTARRSGSRSGGCRWKRCSMSCSARGRE